MKKNLGYILLTLIAVSCSTNDGVFRLKGKFKGFYQGELYVYTLDGKASIDTIRINDGRFTYEQVLDDTATLSVIFPNFSEIPVIASPGASVSMEGDASHLREVTVNGDDENDLLTKFRLQVSEQTPPEAVKSAAAFINEHPGAVSSMYVLNRYFLLKTDADLDQASKLLAAMKKAAPENKQLGRLKKEVDGLKQARKGSKLPNFSAVTTTGYRVTNADLKGELNVISVWSTWNYDSQSVQRQLRKFQKQYGSRLGLLSICMDGNPADCKQTSKRDSTLWNTVCDGRMWNMPIVAQLAVSTIPDIIITDRSGKILDRGLNMNELISKVEEKLGK